MGALFAAFAFAISVFGVPMLLQEKTDALSALGISMAMVWNNMVVMLVWGAIVFALFAASVLTAFAGLIVVFGLLGLVAPVTVLLVGAHARRRAL